MTALAKRIAETPIAPYLGILQSMSHEEKKIVVTFLTESMAEQKQKTNEELIREKFKNLKISSRAKALVDGLSLSAEEMNDERTKHLLKL